MKKSYLMFPDDPPAIVMEDLIGKTWRCFNCGEQVIISPTGVEHSGENHGLYFQLNELFSLSQWEQKQKVKWIEMEERRAFEAFKKLANAVFTEGEFRPRMKVYGYGEKGIEELTALWSQAYPHEK